MFNRADLLTSILSKPLVKGLAPHFRSQELFRNPSNCFFLPSKIAVLCPIDDLILLVRDSYIIVINWLSTCTARNHNYIYATGQASTQPAPPCQRAFSVFKRRKPSQMIYPTKHQYQHKMGYKCTYPSLLWKLERLMESIKPYLQFYPLLVPIKRPLSINTWSKKGLTFHKL